MLLSFCNVEQTWYEERETQQRYDEPGDEDSLAVDLRMHLVGDDRLHELIHGSQAERHEGSAQVDGHHAGFLREQA